MEEDHLSAHLKECLRIRCSPLKLDGGHREKEDLHSCSCSVLLRSVSWCVFDNLENPIIPKKAQICRKNNPLFNNQYLETSSCQQQNIPVVDVKSVAAIVHEETTAEAVRPVLTECLAVMNISES